MIINRLMMGMTVCLGVILLAVVMTINQARADDWEELAAAARRIATVQADFTQEKRLPMLSRPLVSEGRLYYRAPDSLRWEYVSPIESIMLMKEDRVRMFVRTEGAWREDAGQAIEVRRVILDEITGWFSGRFTTTSTFTPRYEPGPPAQVVLTPRQALTDFIEQVVITFGERPGVIDTVEIVEGSEAGTIIRFTGVEVNADIAEALFETP
jgi:outer membrane lipoprotein carrier protein